MSVSSSSFLSSSTSYHPVLCLLYCFRLYSLCYFITVSVCLWAHHFFFSACLSVCFSRWEVRGRGGAYSQQGWPWQKSDDLRRAAISIIMEELISWCIGLRVRLQKVEVVGCNRRAGGAWLEDGKRERREKGWCGRGGGKCTISLGAVWCCSPCCHTSKREQIKGSSFDEYKTESPAEKHSPSLPF